MKPVTVKQEPGNEIPAEVLATAICDLAEAAKRFNGSRLKQRTIILLLNDATGVPKRDIGLILDASEELAKRYVK